MNVVEQSEKLSDALKAACVMIKGIKNEVMPDFSAKGLEIEKVLGKDTFDVVVCGEVKKGKSSFINALIGGNVLPTDTRVATAQAFRIVNSNEERYFIKYTDGTKEEIFKDKLATYGSQVCIYSEKEIRIEKSIDHMVVEYPVEFLPPNVNIVDTPGIGALYSYHKAITERFLADAAAVVFVIDPQNPITEPELTFLRKIYAITDRVLIVMTKMDNYDRDVFERVKERNEEILQEKLPQVFKDIKPEIYGFSSKTLLDSVNEEDFIKSIFIDESLYPQLRDQLLNLIHSLVGLSRNIYAFNLLCDFNSQVANRVAEYNKILTDNTQGQDLIRQKNNLKLEFANKWSAPNGSEQKSIVVAVNNNIASFVKRAQFMFSHSSDIYRTLLGEIDSLSNLDDCKTLGRSLPEDLPNRVQIEWNSLVDECIRNINRVLLDFEHNMEKDLIISSDGHSSLKPFASSNMKIMDYFNHMRGGYLTAMFAAGIIGISLSAVVMAPIAAIIAFFSGKQARLERGKADLRSYVSDAFVRLQKDYTINPISDCNPNSLLEETKAKLAECAQKAVNDIYEIRRRDFEKEIQLLDEQIKNDSDGRKAAIVNLSQLRQEWKHVSDKLNEIKNELTSLDNQINNEHNRN